MGLRSVAVAVSTLCAALVAGTAQAQPLATGIFDPLAAAPGSAAEFRDVRAAGAGFVRLALDWKGVAPTSTPASFAPTDPSDPAYRWEAADAAVESAVAAGLRPILDVVDAPSWALVPGTSKPGIPQAKALGQFMRAAASRYGGSFQGLPRVGFWQVWNEPNLSPDLSPQLVDGKPVAAIAYRGMVNAVADAVKAVHPDNVVVAGGLAPFRDQTPEVVKQDQDWGPLSFMRAFFCLTPQLTRGCAAKVRFDVWAHHPYTSGGPTHHAVLPNDVSLGDLAKLNTTLRAAVRAGSVLPRRLPQLWVTEFSWDSNPPDPNGVPTDLLDRWVPQALYQMWRNRVSLVTWFQLRDQTMQAGPYQSGLYYADGKQKPYLLGFRFPVVAFPRAHGFYVWGRTPTSAVATVAVQQRVGSRWTTVARLRANAAGIFQKTLPAPPTGWVRARMPAGMTSLPFSLTAVPDRTYVPFGLGKPLEP